MLPLLKYKSFSKGLFLLVHPVQPCRLRYIW